ncbi:unnamed protein product [Protopolystoma xenopodis]|uniref:Uncharacterized protein n=1 Tax=Protopolystoma xenopodis TaxID=117903 RepID=A0A3S5C664_9PLAT|nr:unnamed protein product [Protopolystoma xenopodis]
MEWHVCKRSRLETFRRIFHAEELKVHQTEESESDQRLWSHLDCEEETWITQEVEEEYEDVEEHAEEIEDEENNAVVCEIGEASELPMHKDKSAEQRRVGGIGIKSLRHKDSWLDQVLLLTDGPLGLRLVLHAELNALGLSNTPITQFYFRYADVRKHFQLTYKTARRPESLYEMLMGE